MPGFTSQGRTSAVRRPERNDLQHPAARAVGIAHLTPAFELLDDLEREPGAPIDPSRGIVGAGAVAHVDPVGLEADEARHRQPGCSRGGLRGDAPSSWRRAPAAHGDSTTANVGATHRFRPLDRHANALTRPVLQCDAYPPLCHPNDRSVRHCRSIRSTRHFVFPKSHLLDTGRTSQAAGQQRASPQWNRCRRAKEADRHRYAQAARRGRNAHARAVRCPPQRRRRAADASAAGRSLEDWPTCWCRPSPTASTVP